MKPTSTNRFVEAAGFSASTKGWSLGPFPKAVGVGRKSIFKGGWFNIPDFSRMLESQKYEFQNFCGNGVVKST